ncbi:MAG: hypothetical protein SOW14_00445 [Agathobacter sp.]|nr:hypothetical protein [Lachnospiraceae bacterium]MDY2619109.1 hypothetical protein [Agathobacter sp.]
MKKKDTKARTQIIFGALILALFFSVELYMMINYSDKYLIIAGIALVELIFLYVIIQGIFALKEEKEIRNEAQYDNVFKSEKASYLMLKKYFEEFEDKLNYLEKASKVPTEEIVNAQKGIAKVVMNRTRQGSEAMLNSTEQIADQLAEVQKQSEAFQSLLSSCKEEIIAAQKSAGNSSEKSVQMQIQDLVVQMKDMELRLNAALSQNQKVIVQSVPASFGTTSDEKSFLNEVMADEVADTDDDLEETVEPEPVVVPEPNSAPEPVVAPEPIPAPEPVAVPEPIPEPEPVVVPEPESDPNRSLSPDEIAALFANMGNDSTSEAKEEPVQEPAPEVIEKPTVAEKTEAPADSTQPMPDSSDPNKTLSPDEIAALFANMGN